MTEAEFLAAEIIRERLAEVTRYRTAVNNGTDEALGIMLTSQPPLLNMSVAIKSAWLAVIDGQLAATQTALNGAAGTVT